MHRKQIFSLLLIPLLVITLAACSAQAKSDASTTKAESSSAQDQASQDQNQEGQAQVPDMSDQPIEQKLAIGTLKLEGTANAVTADEAAELLPLWKAVKSMSTGSNTSTEEMNALYEQIQGTMTAEQVQAIKDLELTMEDTQALMKEFGVEMSQAGGPDSLTQDERATRIAQFQAEGGGQTGNGNFPGGGGNVPGGGGIPGGGIPGGGAIPGGDTQQSGQPPVIQGTPPAGGRNGGGGPGGGFNTMFIDPLIKLLEERAAS